MALPVTITGISTAVAPVGPFKVAAGNYSAVAINTGGTTASGVNLTGTSTGTALGQSFTNPTGSNLVVASAAVQLTRSATPPAGDIYAEITTTDLSGTVVATSTALAMASLSTTASAVTFTFPSPPTISGSATFGLVLRRTTADGNAITVLTATNSYAGGAAYSYNGTSWTVVAGSADFVTCTINSQTTVASDVYYFFGRDGTTATTLQAFKSTAPDTSWASVATKTGFTTAILNIAAVPSGTTFHLLLQDGTMSSSVATKYVSFDAITDTFLASIETVAAAAAITGQSTSGWGASLVVRSNSNAVALYNGLQTNTSGTARARLYYRERTGLNTYGTATRVDANTAVDNTSPIVVLGTSNRLHFLWLAGTVIQRHLTSANALGTAASTGPTAAALDAVSFDNSGVQHVGFTPANAFRWASADNPTVTNTSVTFGTPVRTVDDNNVVYALYQNSGDGDLYIKSSSDNGATFGSAVSAFTGTVAASDASVSKNQRAYQRGSSVIFPYIVNDGGTLKYNEYVTRSLSTNYTDTITPSALPIAGADITGVYVGSVAYTDTITAGAVPIDGQTITPTYTVNYTDTLTASAVPIDGQTVTPTYTVNYTDTLTASAVPIGGQTVTPTYTANYIDTLTAGTLPITGLDVVPVYSAGGINYSDTITPSALPVSGSTITPIYTVNITDTISVSALPISGATIAPVYTANYADTLVAGALPVGGATLVDMLARGDTLAPSSVPVGGATVADLYNRADTLTAGTLPIIGVTIAPVYTARYADTLTAGVLLISGQAITPVFSAGEINYSDTIVASSLPVAGQTITAVYSARYSDTIAASVVPVTGLTLADVLARGDILVPSGIPIGGQTITPDFAVGAPTGKTWVKVGGVWEEATTYVKVGGVWVHPIASFVKDGGVWKGIQ